MNLKIHISKEMITFRNDNDVLLEECKNNLSSPRILIQNVRQAEEFFREKCLKYSNKIVRPIVTLTIDENIFEDGLTNTEERIIFHALIKNGARKLFYKDKKVGYEPF